MAIDVLMPLRKDKGFTNPGIYQCLGRYQEVRKRKSVTSSKRQQPLNKKKGLAGGELERQACVAVWGRHHRLGNPEEAEIRYGVPRPVIY